MSFANKTIKLILLHDTKSEAERLISMLKNAGKSVRAQYVENRESLDKVLREKSWDLLIAHDQTANVPPDYAKKAIRKFNKDIPILLLTDSTETHAIVEGIKLGAADVITVDEDQHLLLVIDREITARNDREQRRIADMKRAEAENNNQGLLDSSRDGIAFVQDGMFLYVNDSFAEILNYEDKGDLDCMPVVDIVNKQYRNNVKDFLKEFALKGAGEGDQVKFTAVTASGEDKILSADVKLGIYEEESCIQFVIKAKSGEDSEALQQELEKMKSRDMETGLYNRDYFIQKLDKAMDAAKKNKFNSAVLNIKIDKLTELVSKKLGPSGMGKTVKAIADFAQTLIKDHDFICRFSQETLMILLPKIDASSALTRAESFSMAMRDHIIDIDGTTLQFQYFVGVATVNESSRDPDTTISNSSKAVEEVAEKAANGEECYALPYQPEVPTGDDKNFASLVQHAIDNQQFKLLFQPILSLRGSEKEHYEVLLRMISPEGEYIYPKEFLSDAAEIGVTKKIDRWVILEATKILAEKRKNRKNTHLLVHLSRASLQDESLPPWLGVAFKAAKLPASSVIFQISEIHANDHLTAAKSLSEKLKAMGSTMGIANFGCALNPFNILKHVQASYFKVDGSFTQEIQNGTEETQALNELVSQLHEEEKLTVVPHVEGAAVLAKLWQTGVHFIQGHYLQVPTESMDYDFDMES